MIAKFYCSKKTNPKTKEIEFRFKAAKKKDVIIFKTLEDAITHLKSLKLNATMWIRENEVFVSGVKTRIGDTPEEEVKVEIVKFVPKAKPAPKKEEKPVTKNIEVKKEEIKPSFDDEDCEECKALEEDSKEWANNIEFSNNTDTNNVVSKDTSKQEESKVQNVVECKECELLEKEEYEAKVNNNCVECDPSLVNSLSKDSKTNQLESQKIQASESKEEKFDCDECAAIEAEIAKWDEEIMSSTLEQEGNIFLLEATQAKKDAISSTKEDLTASSRVLNSNSQVVNGNLGTLFVTNDESLIGKESNDYVLLNKKTNDEKPINIFDLNELQSINAQNVDLSKYSQRRESLWTRTNYVLWFLLWMVLMAAVIVIIVVLFMNGYSK